jgi:tRNA 2-thiouridine synthesizing protein C
MSSLLFIQSTAPHGTINAQEGLDALLMGSAFTQCTALFTGPGVLQLVRDQQPDALGFRNFSLGFGALKDYGVTRVYCREDSLHQFDLKPEDLVIPIEVLSEKAIQELISEHDKVLNF